MQPGGVDLDDLKAFFLVAETGSFARAAQRLESSKSIVSRRVARLENLLAAQLLQRTAQGTHLTEAGQLYYEQARAAVVQLECAAENLAESVHEISGAIRVTVPIYFGAKYLAPVFCDFMQLYPRIDLEVHLSDEKIDIARSGFDIAVRTGHLPDSSLTYRPLCESRRVAVASPEYLRSQPPITKPEDLSQHRILHYNSLHTQDLWRYHLGGAMYQLEITPHLRSNSATMLMTAVCAGIGVTMMPVYVAGQAIQSGTAEEVLKDVDWGMSPISLLTPSGRGTTKRVRTLLDFLALRFNSRVI